jgi:hypothetical protein
MYDNGLTEEQGAEHIVWQKNKAPQNMVRPYVKLTQLFNTRKLLQFRFETKVLRLETVQKLSSSLFIYNFRLGLSIPILWLNLYRPFIWH